MKPALNWRAMRTMLGATGLALGSQLAVAQNLTQDDIACGTFIQPGRLTPEDYRKASPRLKVVEDYHFGPSVEALVRPMQKGMALGSDLDYTLWGYPNHHRALAALVRLGAREKTEQPRGTQFSIDCYFRRALRIADTDLIVRMLYANYLGSAGRKPQAMQQLGYVVENAGDNAMTHYNAGLIYLELGAYAQASAQARHASQLGFGRTTLRDELQRLGKWDATADGGTSVPAAPEAAASAAAR